jgi:Uncharacterized conserved protein
MPKTYIGTSGWVYKDWGKKFFPKGLPASKHLPYLATQFNTVEINGTFYRLQPKSAFKKWHDETTPEFRFAVKVSRFITHILRMKAASRAWAKFFKRTTPLKGKLGPFLFQFPSSFHGKKENIARLRTFLRCYADPKLRFAFEFRHDSWFIPEILSLLRRYRAAMVLANSSKYPTAPLVATGDFIYCRLHGPKKLFSSSYSEAQLREWAALLMKFRRQGKDIFVYFNNDQNANAPANARLLQRLMA